ncbi:hypothetical protein [Arthrobacter sp. StoSoilB22]|nr:hypothetical protein [Arthrobacter sp. StoSoilB22]
MRNSTWRPVHRNRRLDTATTQYGYTPDVTVTVTVTVNSDGDVTASS